MRLTRLNQLIHGRETMDGTWQLTKRHELQYRRRDGSREIVLTGNLVAAEPTALVAQFREISSDEVVTSRLFWLRGRWQADSRNRLNFLIQREQGKEDRLTLEGGWEVNQANEILYRYQRDLRSRGNLQLQTFRFQGRWDLGGANQLTYLLDENSDSTFRFRGTFQTPSILAKDGAIRYQVGVEVEGKKRFNVVTLFGAWKLSRDLALDFDLATGGVSSRTIRFGATYQVDSDDAISARLTTAEGKPLGLEVIFTRDFLKGQGQGFVRLVRSLEETAVEGGLRFRW